jgi:hypothetical protein
MEGISRRSRRGALLSENFNCGDKEHRVVRDGIISRLFEREERHPPKKEGDCAER